MACNGLMLYCRVCFIVVLLRLILGLLFMFCVDVVLRVLFVVVVLALWLSIHRSFVRVGCCCMYVSVCFLIVLFAFELLGLFFMVCFVLMLSCVLCSFFVI